MPVIGLALPLGVLCPQQIRDSGEPRAIAVLENAQTLRRLIHRSTRRLQLQRRCLPVNVRLADFETQVLLRGRHLRVDFLFCRVLPRQLRALANRQKIHADLDAGYPVVAA